MRQLTVLFSVFLAAAVAAREWHVHPEGDAASPGTQEKPCDIASALDGSKKIAPGDTIVLAAGTYKRRPKEQFEVKLVGAEGKPIVIRPAAGARATIDGGLAIQPPSAHVWIRDLEILVSEPLPDKPVPAGSHPQELTKPSGGLNCFGGKNCKYINLVIHDTRQAMSVWKGELDCEIYGCIAYDNGWLGTDRGHGHCLYTQNKDGVKTISNCIFTARFNGAYTMHAYGSKNADVDNYVVEDNVCFETGKFLIGGGRPSHNIKVARNYLYNQSMRIGYDAPENEDCEVRDNFIVNGGLEIVRYKKAVNENNTIIKKGDKLPAEPKIVLLPNKYDDKRANLVIYNFTNQKEIAVPAGTFIKDGEAFELLDPKKFFEKPMFEGKCADGKMTVPVAGEFSVYVVRRK
ncbi:MAG TPA: hypothetical protein VEJ63_00250 [Planctomycetota bacterium]|nr:hypothetical protein [Planctomycetota bacterium]